LLADRFLIAGTHVCWRINEPDPLTRRMFGLCLRTLQGRCL